MATIVWGHGTRDRGEEKTFVPQGSTVKWYSEVDENLLTTNGFLAIAAGNFGSPVEVAGPGDGVKAEMYNYGVFPDQEKWDYVGILNDRKNELLFIGGDVPQGHLCNDVDGCKNAGEHKCDGVFGKAGTNAEIVIMVCRGIPGGNAATQKFGGDDKDALSGFQEDLSEFVNTLYNQIKSDPEAAERSFDSLPNASLVMLAPYDFIKAWKAVRWAADAGRNGEVASMWDQMRGEEGNTGVEEFLKLPRYSEGIAAGAKADPDEFFGYLDQWTSPVYRLIEAVPEVLALRQEWEQKQQRIAQAQAQDWHPTDADYDKISELNGSNVKAADDGDEIPILAGGVVMLIGSGHEADPTSYVRRQQDFERGTVKVKKGGAFSSGSLTVKGISAKQDLVTRLAAEFTNKKVNFE